MGSSRVQFTCIHWFNDFTFFDSFRNSLKPKSNKNFSLIPHNTSPTHLIAPVFETLGFRTTISLLKQYFERMCIRR